MRSGGPPPPPLHIASEYDLRGVNCARQREFYCPTAFHARLLSLRRTPPMGAFLRWGAERGRVSRSVRGIENSGLPVARRRGWNLMRGASRGGLGYPTVGGVAVSSESRGGPSPIGHSDSASCERRGGAGSEHPWRRWRTSPRLASYPGPSPGRINCDTDGVPTLGPKPSEKQATLRKRRRIALLTSSAVGQRSPKAM